MTLDSDLDCFLHDSDRTKRVVELGNSKAWREVAEELIAFGFKAGWVRGHFEGRNNPLEGNDKELRVLVGVLENKKEDEKT